MLPHKSKGKCSVFPADQWQNREEDLIFLNSTPELCSLSHTATERLLFGYTYLSHRAVNLGKGWSNNPTHVFFFNFIFRSGDPRAVLGLASGNAILISLKILVLLVGSLVQHFPSRLLLWGWTFSRCWLCEKKKKEGQISSSLDLPREWFSSRDPNLKLLLPAPGP